MFSVPSQKISPHSQGNDNYNEGYDNNYVKL